MKDVCILAQQQIQAYIQEIPNGSKHNLFCAIPDFHPSIAAEGTDAVNTSKGWSVLHY